MLCQPQDPTFSLMNTFYLKSLCLFALICFHSLLTISDKTKLTISLHLLISFIYWQDFFYSSEIPQNDIKNLTLLRNVRFLILPCLVMWDIQRHSDIFPTVEKSSHYLWYLMPSFSANLFGHFVFSIRWHVQSNKIDTISMVQQNCWKWVVYMYIEIVSIYFSILILTL